MILKERLKAEIDNLDERYEEQRVAILQEIADSGGLGIPDPSAWQRDIRQDRLLPFRKL
jgi:hypothetical protein